MSSYQHMTRDDAPDGLVQPLMGEPVLLGKETSPQLPNGFRIWEAKPLPASCGMQIIGSEYSQILELTVQPGQRITAEPGTMLHMEPGIKMEADVGGIQQGCTRCCCAGESMFRT